jgi:monofunctional biosynthetic peptidoglycan transglycosylase
MSSLILVGIFSHLPTPTSAFMLQKHVDDLLEGKGYIPIAQHWVSQSEISKPVFGAVIASEDQLFYRHYGFDLEAINKALQHNLQSGKLRGASTISQQVAKNLFLSPSKSFVRKGLEVWFTLLIEMFWTKARILEVYLNIAEFGDHLYGVEAASRRYFGIPARQLTAEQSALLAATLPNPAQFKADQPTAYLHRRQTWILRQMRNL